MPKLVPEVKEKLQEEWTTFAGETADDARFQQIRGALPCATFAGTFAGETADDARFQQIRGALPCATFAGGTRILWTGTMDDLRWGNRR